MPLPSFGRAAAGPTLEVVACRADLDRLGREEAGLAGPAGCLAALLPLLVAEGAEREAAAAYGDGLDRDRVETAARAGVPLFRAAPPPLVADALHRRVGAIVALLAAGHPPMGPLRRAVRRRQVPVAAWAGDFLGGRHEAVAAAAAGLGLDPDGLLAALRLALLPALAPASSRADGLRPGDAWARGDCPNCGAPPLLAESRGLDARRALRCGTCAADWPAPRMACPSCGAADPGGLSYHFLEGQESRRRILMCAVCDADLAIVATLGPLTPLALLVAELRTLPLRLAARRIEPPA